MEKEFKFRAFNGIELLSQDKLECLNLQLSDLSNGYFQEVMMYLFYKDKNGTEVYQNDILKSTILNQRNNTYFYEYSIADFNKPMNSSYPYCLGCFEVIGNKYDNNELFNETLNKK